MSTNRPGLGISLMILTTLVFAIQDGISRHLGDIYGVILIVMIRYWFFAAFVVGISSAQTGGIARVARTHQPYLQIVRGVLLVAEIVVMVTAFTRLGLAASHAIFATYPLIVAALAGPVLGEKVGWRRWSAIGIGFLGLLVILRPGSGALSVDALIPLLAAIMFALYQILTRLAAREDEARTSFFWTGIAGAVAITLVGAPQWTMLSPSDWLWMTTLGCTGALGHYLLIKALDVAEAAVVQPFAYFQLVFASLVGVLVFREHIDAATILGATVITSAGIFALVREAALRRRGT